MKFKCQGCDHVLSSESGLKYHLKRPHIKCEICLALTTDAKSHKKQFHATDYTRYKLKCDLCNYEGASTKHIRIHIDKAHKQRDPLKIEKQEPL